MDYALCAREPERGAGGGAGGAVVVRPPPPPGAQAPAVRRPRGRAPGATTLAVPCAFLFQTRVCPVRG